MPIGPNGKKLFGKALPKDKGGYVLANGEDHRFSSHIKYFTENIVEFKGDHNLGTIGFEDAPCVMLFFWMYQDARPEQKKDAEEKLRKAMVGYDWISNNAANLTTGLITAASAQGVKPITFDARHLFDELKIQYAQEMQYIKDHPNLDFGTIGDNKHIQFGWVLAETQKLYNANPDYARRLDSIENFVKEMRAKNIPTDAISAMVAANLANPNSNMITFSGNDHLNGKDDTRGWLEGADVTGIFSDVLKRRDWHVTKVIVGNKDSVKHIENSKKDRCASYHVVDATYEIGKDRLKTNFAPPEHRGALEVIVDWMRGHKSVRWVDDFSCSESPPVEKVFKQWELDPTKLPGVAQEVEQMKKAVESSYHHASNGVVKKPLPHTLHTPPK